MGDGVVHCSGGLRPSTGLTATLLDAGLCLRGAGYRYACQPVQILAPYRERRGLCARERRGAAWRISWCCAGAAVLCLAAVFICYRPFAVLAAAAGFMALLVRVLKNAFAQAVRMKNELDYTI